MIMMNKIIRMIALLTFALVYGCETYVPAGPDLTNTYPAYVEIAGNAAVTVPEGGSVTLGLTTRTVVYEGYTVTWEISGDYSATGTVEVPGGVNQYQVSIPIEAGIVSDGALQATVTLTDVSGEMELGRNGRNTALEITITKFVPFVQEDYAITFSCNEPGYGDYMCDFVAAEDPNVLINTNFWDSEWEINYTFSADFDQKVVIEPQQKMYGDTPLTISGSGTYDGVTQRIIVDYIVVDDTGAVWDDNTHTFTKPV
jgi:hypothetical protein